MPQITDQISQSIQYTVVHSHPTPDNIYFQYSAACSSLKLNQNVKLLLTVTNSL